MLPWKMRMRTPRGHRQDDDAVGVDQPIAPTDELTREVAVARHEIGEPGKVGEGGVGGEHEDDHGDGLDEVVEEAAPEHLARELGDHRLLVAGDDPVEVGKGGDADEERDHDDAQRDEDLLGVAHLGRLEGGHPVRHRLDSGEGDGSGGERAQEEENADLAHVLCRGQAGGRRGAGPAEQVGDEPIGDEGEIAGDEEIAPHREDPTRFPQTPQVGHADERDHSHPEQDPVGSRASAPRR